MSDSVGILLLALSALASTTTPPHSGAAAGGRVGEVEVVNRAPCRVVGAHGNDTEGLAHGEGRERAEFIDALEQVKPLELRVGALVREVVRRGHAERLEPARRRA